MQTSDEDYSDRENIILDNKSTNGELPKLPAETPEWGIKLLEIMQGEFRAVANAMGQVEADNKNTKINVQRIEKKLTQVEKHNKNLECENAQLKGKLLDLEYRQQRNNLVFEGISDSQNETDFDCIRKLHHVLRGIPGIDVNKFRIDRCHCLDGPFRPSRTRRVICTFNWYYDIQCTLRHRKQLPKGIYVSEDVPEKWIDRRKILKPVFNAAKRDKVLKDKMHLTRDKLIIDSQVFTAGPKFNLDKVNDILNLQATC